MRFSKRKLHFLFFPFVCWRPRNRKNKKKENGKRQKNPIKIGFFLRWSCKNVKNQKRIFSKNWLTLFVSGREKKRAFSCTLSVLAKKCFWPKTV